MGEVAPPFAPLGGTLLIGYNGIKISQDKKERITKW